MIFTGQIDMKEEIRSFVKNDRWDFQNAPLEVADMAADPFKQFEIWFSQLLQAKVLDPYAFTLATADAHGRPSARLLYMRDITDQGLSCFTNYNSSKGHDLEANPQFSANFYWQELSRQVRFGGRVQKLPDAVSDDYFASRPRESRIGAWASDQSEEIPDRSYLESRVRELTASFEGKDIPRPPHWGGYLLIPDTVEFWQGRQSRLHDRMVYKKLSTGSWTLNRLAP